MDHNRVGRWRSAPARPVHILPVEVGLLQAATTRSDTKRQSGKEQERGEQASIAEQIMYLHVFIYWVQSLTVFFFFLRI